MKPYQRVEAAFAHHDTDKVPIYQAGFSSFVASYVLGREAFVGGGIQRYREAVALWNGGHAHEEFVERSFEDACELCEKLDLDLVRTIYWRKEEKPSERIDENTFVYGDRAGGRYEVWRFDPPTETYGPIETHPVYAPTTADLREEAERARAAAEEYRPAPETFSDSVRSVERFAGKRAVPGTGVGISVPREREWLEATVLSPEIVGIHLDAAAVRAGKNAAVMSEIGLPYCFGGGDFAGKFGPFYSPATFHALMLPRLQAISDACHRAGVNHLFASDGDLWPVAEDLFGASGVDGFYEIDRNYMDFAALRERFPRLVLLGGVRSELLHVGTASEVRDETRTALRFAQEFGGCIIGCSNQIVIGTPEENFWAMMDVLHNER